jgi:CRP/FNR family cyclic AMP-dependent transcriptional regulator
LTGGCRGATIGSMLRKNAKVELLRSAPLLSRLSGKQLSDLASLVDEIDLPAGKELTTQGKAGHEFFVLVEGSADVLRNGAKVNTMRGGDFFGEIALLSGAPRTATVTATTPVRALVLTRRDFRALLRNNPAIQERVLDAVVERLPVEL